MAKKYLVNSSIYEEVVRKTFQLNEDYPLGAANDPAAPYNQGDSEMYREIDLKPSEIYFDVIAVGGEFAIVQDKTTKKYYVVYLDASDDDLKQFIAGEKIHDGKDEDGEPNYDINYENSEIDDKAITSLASYLKMGNHYGTGIDAYESGLMAEIDGDLRDELIKTFRGFEKYGKRREYEHLIDILGKI